MLYFRWKNGNKFEDRSGVNGQHPGVNHVVQLANLLPAPFDQTIRVSAILSLTKVGKLKNKTTSHTK